MGKIYNQHQRKHVRALKYNLEINVNVTSNFQNIWLIRWTIYPGEKLRAKDKCRMIIYFKERFVCMIVSVMCCLFYMAIWFSRCTDLLGVGNFVKTLKYSSALSVFNITSMDISNNVKKRTSQWSIAAPVL